MACHSNKENHPLITSRLPPCQRKLSTKKSKANKNAQEAATGKQLKKQLQTARAKKQALAKKASAIVERTGDSKEVHDLKARVHQAELERNAAEHQAELAFACRSSTHTTTQPESIPHPHNLSKVTGSDDNEEAQ
ncbi:hypothetical protein BDZ94DRAFT_1303116 [Collybia nuda]|uniref:Uncharacterized protein n=1 Tax=Collybia nuda TaxID=64659 RepID=A0A9P5XTB6_9AGAR|nr:hypothetical protein BDZ94DRAFT_1303116 [Collybia nuda]